MEPPTTIVLWAIKYIYGEDSLSSQVIVSRYGEQGSFSIINHGVHSKGNSILGNDIQSATDDKVVEGDKTPTLKSV